jgi:hypothetical protein
LRRNRSAIPLHTEWRTDFCARRDLIPPLLGARREFDWFDEMRRYRDTGFNMVRVSVETICNAYYEACRTGHSCLARLHVRVRRRIRKMNRLCRL